MDTDMMGSRERAVFHIGNHIAAWYAPLKTVDDMNAAGDTVVRMLEKQGLTIVPANLLDAVIAATRDGMSNQYDFSIGIMGEDDRLKCLYLEMNQAAIAAIRAAWEVATDGH